MTITIASEINEKPTKKLTSSFLEECSKYEELKFVPEYKSTGSNQTSHFYDISEKLTVKNDEILLSYSKDAELSHGDSLSYSKKEDVDYFCEKNKNLEEFIENNGHYATIKKSNNAKKELNRDLYSIEAKEVLDFFGYKNKERIVGEENILEKVDTNLVKTELINYGVPEFFVNCAINAFYGIEKKESKYKEAIERKKLIMCFKNQDLDYEKLLKDATQTQRELIYNRTEEGDLVEKELPRID